MSKEKEYINFKEAVQLFLSRTIPELKSEEELPGINFIFSNDSFELFEYIKDNPYTKSNSWVPSLDYHDISNALPENNQNPSYPTIEIKNPIAFFELLTAITNAWLDLNNKYYGAVSGRALFISNIKRLWLRMSPNDFINVLEFLKRELKFLKTSFFEEFIKKEIAVGEYCNFKIYATKEINESWYETNEKISLNNDGIVITDKSVVRDTIVAESGVSAPNFSENIVVFAAEGADAAITHDISTTPLIPRIYSPQSKVIGKITSLSATERYADSPFIYSFAPAR